MSIGQLVGHVLDGKYSIEKQLGKGGMGTVYLAVHIGTGRPVAVKVIAPDYMQKAEFVERFRREARAAGRLRHPNVVDVTDFGFAEVDGGDEVAYLVMEYLDGCTLGEVLDEEKHLPVSWSLDIIEQVCSAVGEAHKQGIIHRDLKPDNIWLEPNQRGGYTVKVLDFGIAKLEETGAAGETAPQGGDSPSDGDSRGVRKTVVAESTPATIAESDSETIIPERGTVVGGNEAGTRIIDSEGEDALASGERGKASGDLEQQTAILPAAATVTDDRSKPGPTDSLHGATDTGRSLMDSPSTEALTRIGAVLGTPLYMSPEQCRGESLTPSSDIYSIAVIAYQMLSGKLPFAGDYMEVMNAHKSLPPPPLRARKVKKRLSRTVMESLSKDTALRPDSAEAFANKLRANSEGIGNLLTRAFVIYAERLPKFLMLAVITFLPLILITLSRVGLNFARTANLIEDGFYPELASALLSVIGFFLQIVSAALLVGMTTWVVAQILAYPLRPIRLWSAFQEARSKIRSLAANVTISNLIAIVGLAFLFLPGVWISARFMLIAPSIMMEGVKGRAAFKRSMQLTKRSFRTVFATTLLIYVVPVVMALVIGLSIGSIIGNFQKANELSLIKSGKVVPVKEEKAEKKEKEKGGIQFSLGSRNVKLDDDDSTMAGRLSKGLQEGLFELLWTPLALLISSFASVISALIYFKTRQAGGESMQALLGKLNTDNCTQSKWQQRVGQRLLESGKMTKSPGSSR